MWGVARVHPEGSYYYDQRRAPLEGKISVADVMNSRKIAEPLKLLDCCPNSDGAAAIIIAGEEVAAKAARDAYEALDPRPVKTQQAAVIFSADVARALLGGILALLLLFQVMRGWLEGVIQPLVLSVQARAAGRHPVGLLLFGDGGFSPQVRPGAPADLATLCATTSLARASS